MFTFTGNLAVTKVGSLDKCMSCQCSFNSGWYINIQGIEVDVTL